MSGKLVRFNDGSEITELREGTTGDLIVQSIAVTNEERLKEYNSEKIVTFLPSGTKLRARVRTWHVPDELGKRFVPSEKELNTDFVEIIVQQDLQLQLRGTKEGRLMPCSCLVPALISDGDDGIRTSVNEAYSFISTHFEPHGRSSTGNVFDVVFYLFQAPILRWQPLRSLRDQKKAEYEAELLNKSDPSASQAEGSR